MPNPKAPRIRRTPRPAAPPTVAFPLERLYEAGASVTEIQEARAMWEGLSEIEREATVNELHAMNDEELRALIREAHDDDTFVTVEAAGDGVTDDTLAFQMAQLRAAEWTAAQTLEWVGADPTRAQAAIAVEERREKPRLVLTRDLKRIAGPGA